MPRRPAVGDPVVVRGEKYRVKEITRGIAHCRQSFGSRIANVRLEDLEFDREAGMWRPHHRRGAR